jgi:hypothetical protein
MFGTLSLVIGSAPSVPHMSDRTSRPATKSGSDRPASDLNKERDVFIQTFFKKGAQLTEELLKENERLGKELRSIEAENAALRAQVKSDEAIRDLLRKIEALEQEKLRLVSCFRDAQAQTDEYASTFAEVESELANLASLYVASNQLHSTLNLRGVMRQIKEMLAQLVGARSFAIYFVSDDNTRLLPISIEGARAEEIGAVRVGEGPVGTAFLSGAAAIAETSDLPTRTVDSPAACVPLRVEDRVVGVISIFSTYEQKTKFVPVDYEFFKLLAAHAASAIVAARLFAERNGKTPGIEAFLDLGV